MNTENSSPPSTLKRLLPIAVVLAIALALGVAILGSEKSTSTADEHAHEAHAEAADHDDKAAAQRERIENRLKWLRVHEGG